MGPKTRGVAPGRRTVVLSGPHLNLLGERDPSAYGRSSLADVESRCEALALKLGFQQSNHEGVLIDAIHETRPDGAAIVINPGGYAHTFVALADALAMCPVPVIEVHVSNVHRREACRRVDHVGAEADAVLCGCGMRGYLPALRHIAHLAEEVQ